MNIKELFTTKNAAVAAIMMTLANVVLLAFIFSTVWGMLMLSIYMYLAYTIGETFGSI